MCGIQRSSELCCVVIQEPDLRPCSEIDLNMNFPSERVSALG